MKAFYWVYKGNPDEMSWEAKFDTYEEALEFIQGSSTVSHQYWKIEKIWEWPF